jgi:SAM-dependent methyltransferase
VNPTSSDLPPEPLTTERVRANFNDPGTVLHYARAAQNLGLWTSERILIEQWLPDCGAPLLEVGCGAGRALLALWQLGYRDLTGVDFAESLLDVARRLASLQAAGGIRWIHAEASRLQALDFGDPPRLFAGVLFLFNGLMQLPGRSRRRDALRALHGLCRTGAPLIFTSHDRDDDTAGVGYWRRETERWSRGEQDPRLIEFGDRYFINEHGGHTFMHLPVRGEIVEDLAATGWVLRFDAMRRAVATEPPAVREFADECRFWVASRG